MSSSISLNTAFALVLAAQAESVGTARLDAPVSNAAASKLDNASLLATLDPTRAAFASALQSLDVANAPQVAGPLTEDDIFDPSNLYSLPGQELVVVAGAAEASVAAIAASLRPGSETILADTTSRDVGAKPGGAFDDGEAGHPGGAAQQAAFVTASGSKRPVDLGAAANLEVRPSTLTLELLVVDYMSQRQVGLSPMKRKILRGLKSRIAPFFDDRSWSGADSEDCGDTRRQT